jgi:4-amino-4-deoxy-L-arabinose transferase-like glycosyltransferase
MSTAELTCSRHGLPRTGWNQFRFILLLMAAYFIGNSLNLALNVRTAKGAQTLVSSDSGQYLAIADQFLGGNFSMDYLREVPHRQPLYPLLLAAATKLGNGNLFFLGLINVLAMTVALGSIYFGVLRFFRSQTVATVSAFCLACNPFMWRTASARLLTEPLYALILIWVVIAFLQYLRERKVVWILLGALFAGLDYLTRPNGVFDAAAFLSVLFLAELLWLTPSDAKKQHFFWRALHLVPNYLCAALLLIAVTTPAWIPRLVYFGDPLYHGYLTNFLWVDTYRYAHDFGEKFASYTFQDYASTHNLLDVIGRLVHGLWNVCLKIPIGNEKVPFLFLLSAAGIWTAVRRGPNEYRFLLLFFVIQLMPFIWTNLANPTARVPYGSTLPFEPFFAACFLARYAAQLDAVLGSRLEPRLMEKNG